MKVKVKDVIKSISKSSYGNYIKYAYIDILHYRYYIFLRTLFLSLFLLVYTYKVYMYIYIYTKYWYKCVCVNENTRLSFNVDLYNNLILASE